MEKQSNTKPDHSRRKFILQTAIAGVGLSMAGHTKLFSQTLKNTAAKNIKSKGYAAKDVSGKLSLWEFERRPVGDNDILIDIKFASICHSDIHQMRGDCYPKTKIKWQRTEVNCILFLMRFLRSMISMLT